MPPQKLIAEVYEKVYAMGLVRPAERCAHGTEHGPVVISRLEAERGPVVKQVTGLVAVAQPEPALQSHEVVPVAHGFFLATAHEGVDS